MGKIRLLLALSVVAAHCGSLWKLNLVGGQIAVQSFFIISGFYMSLILNNKYVGRNGSYKLFITNRFLRLYPIYFTVLLLTVILYSTLPFLSKEHLHTQFDSYAEAKMSGFSLVYLVLANIFIFGQDLIWFLGIHSNGNLFVTANYATTAPRLYSFLFIIQAWTLGIELMFYLIAPFALKKGFKIVVLLTLLSILLRFFLYYYLGLKNDPWTFRFFPTEIVFFFIGYLSFRIYLVMEKRKILTNIKQCIMYVLIAFTLFYQFVPFTHPWLLNFSLREILYLSFLTLSIPAIFSYSKKSRMDKHIGELSYPVYISHMFVAVLCSVQPVIQFKSALFIAFFTIILSYVLNKFIAEPIEVFRQSRLKNSDHISVISLPN